MKYIFTPFTVIFLITQFSFKLTLVKHIAYYCENIFLRSVGYHLTMLTACWSEHRFTGFRYIPVDTFCFEVDEIT